MFKIMRVNMSDLSIKTEDIPKGYEGLGIASRKTIFAGLS